MGLTRIIVAAVAALCCLLTAKELTDRFSEKVVLHEDAIENTRALASEGRWAEVKMLTDYLAERPDLADPRLTGELAQQADSELLGFWKQTQRFADGALSGEPTDWVSMLGSLSLDLFVIGDIRDLAVQGWKQVYYGSGDALIMALSAIGLTTTLAPQVDWAPALIKAMKRSGAFTKRFSKSLMRTSQEALKTGKYGRLSGVVTDMGKAGTHLGPGPLRGVMHAVDSVDDLQKVAKAAEINATGTYALSRLAGRNGVKRISQDGRNIGALVTSLKAGSRATKAAYKLFGAVPTQLLLFIMACAIALFVAAMLFRPGKKFPPGKSVHLIQSSTSNTIRRR